MNNNEFRYLMERLLLAEERIAKLEKVEPNATNPAVVIRVSTTGSAWTDGGVVRIGSKAQTYGSDKYGVQYYRAETAEQFTWK